MIHSGVVAGSASAATFTVPPGPGMLLLANAGTAAVAYVGPGTAVTASNGFPVASGVVPPVMIPLYAGQPLQTWSVITANGTATLSWIVTQPSGGV